MLTRILEEVEAAQGVVSLDEISSRLNVDRSALEGMILFLVRKGRIKDDDLELAAAMGTCDSMNSSCSAGNCPGPDKCAFVVDLPRTFSMANSQGALGDDAEDNSA